MYDSDESRSNNDNKSEMWLKPISNEYPRTIYDCYAVDADTSMSSVESDDNSITGGLDEHLDNKYFNRKDMMSIAKLVQGQPQKKRQKTEDLRPVVFVRFNVQHGQPKPITLVALLDTGASCNLIEEKYTKKLKLHQTKGGTQWSTPAGKMKTT